MNGASIFRTASSLRRYALYNTRALSSKPPTSDHPQASTSKSDSSSSSASASDDAKPSAPQPPQSSPTSLSLDFSPEADPQDEPAQRTGARSSKDSLSSIEKKRRNFGRATMAAFGVGVLVGTFYLGREWEPSELAEKKMVRAMKPSSPDLIVIRLFNFRG